MFGKIAIFVALLVVLGVPFVMSRGRTGSGHGVPAGSPKLIIVTPHVPQIRDEFGPAFSRWHEREFGEPVEVDWRAIGGTSVIKQALESQFRAALNARGDEFDIIDSEVIFPPGTIDFDIMFGGGSYDHGKLKRGIRWNKKTTKTTGSTTTNINLDLTVPISVPAGFTQDQLDAWFGDNVIGTQHLYDPDQYWIGTALSSFGIVYNSDVFEQLGLENPKTFHDLTDPALHGWVALADPRQSGSITTTFDSILGNFGWDEGWRLLRAMCGNARYFTNSSTKPPTDVSQGDAAAGLAIDFYGRGQAQTAGRGRVGYTDPPSVYIDADPVSIIRGGPNPELARRFVAFCMTDEAQAMWQLPALYTPESAHNPVDPDSGEKLGPAHNELRRMPVRRAMYDRYFDHFMDPVIPFEIVSDTKNPGWRTGVKVMMGCFAIDSDHWCRDAWGAIAAARADAGFPPGVLAEMERLYFSWPDTPVNTEGGFDLKNPAERLAWTEANFRPIRDSWRPAGAQERAEIYYTRYFERVYRSIVDMGKTRVSAENETDQ